ncbi:MAG: S41 family peptidase [Marinifilum sp.]|jgi:carboxyl-terminal processing protease|nr:S41 family peptidase [Marinifilum sp.]
MKSFLFVKVIVLIVLAKMCISQAKAQGIDFIKEDWNIVLEKAEKQDKIIFVDVYTTWCGPCKLMSKNIFPLPEVGNYYNNNFINLKINAESKKGMAVAEKYGVNAYPTFLFINKNGKLVRKKEGAYTNGDDFIELGSKVIADKDGNISNKIKGDYLSDKSNIAKLIKYTNMLKEAGDYESIIKLLEDYNEDLKVDKEILEFVESYVSFLTIQSGFYKHIINNMKTYEQIDLLKTNKLIESANVNSYYAKEQDKELSEFIKFIKADVSLNNELKSRIIDKVNLLISRDEYELALHKFNTSSVNEKKINNAALKYKNNLITFVSKFQNKIPASDLFVYGQDLTDLYINVTLKSKENDLKTANLWIELSMKNNNNPVDLSRYSAMVYFEGYKNYIDGKKEEASKKRHEAIGLIEKAIRIYRNNNGEEGVLNSFYSTECMVKKEYNNEPEIQLDKLREINDIVKNECLYEDVTIIDENKIIENALSNLDKYSALLPFEEMNKQIQIAGEELGGIGVTIYKNNSSFIITRVLKNSPAEKSGLRIGDVILQVDGTSADESFTEMELSKRIIGEINTKINLQYKRNNRVKQLELTRAKIEDISVDASYMVNDNLGYIKISKFSNNTHQESVSAINYLKTRGMSTLILDLSDNPGGIRDEAIKLADEFISDDEILAYQKDKNNLEEFRTNTQKTGAFEKGKLIVMINENTASAAELLSGALQDHDRAIFVGRRTFGKGLVQKVFPLMNGEGVKISVAKFLFPSGRCPQRYYREQDRLSRNDLINIGELTDVTKVKLDSSALFKTESGKLVYGNSGVMPDYFVSLELKKENYKQMQNEMMEFNFALEYIQNNEKMLNTLAKDDFVNSFQIDNQTIRDFQERLKNTLPSEGDVLRLDSFSDLFKLELKSIIGRIYYGESVYFKIKNFGNNLYLEALKHS